MMVIIPEGRFEELVKCRWLECVAGGGLAGSGQCFLYGIWWAEDCPEFRDEAQELLAWELMEGLSDNLKSYGGEV
jgi:hypothetical protein